MKLLALTKYGRNAASTRQRLMQFEPYLNDAGIYLDYQPLFTDKYIQLLSEGKRSGVFDIIRSYARRFYTLIAHARPDAIWVQYESFPFMPGFLEKMAVRFKCPIIVDYDDAIFHMYDDHPRAVVRRILGKKILTTVERASLVTVGNNYIGDYVVRANPHINRIPTVVDTDAYIPLTKPADQPLVVGWIGSPSTWRYVEPLLPVILPHVQAAGAVFRAIGAGPGAKQWPGVESVEWSEDTEIAEVQAIDIGIMPLPDERWAKGKCGYKLIQYMACGLPVIASPVGVNREIVTNGVNGILATGSDEWGAAIDRLLESPTMREAFGRAGRERVEQDYSLQAYGPILAKLFAALG